MIEDGATSAPGFSMATRQASALPTSAIAAATAAPQRRTRRNGGLKRAVAGCHEVDELSVDEQRRTRQYRRGDIALVERQRMNDRVGRIRTGGKRLGERAPDQRRGVIQQGDHGVFGGIAIGGRKISIQIGPCQGARRFGPRTGRRGAYPTKKLPDHCDATALLQWGGFTFGEIRNRTRFIHLTPPLHDTGPSLRCSPQRPGRNAGCSQSVVRRQSRRLGLTKGSL
jgi:hypothetical protein